MAANKELTSAQKSAYLSALVARATNDPEMALEIIVTHLRTTMDEKSASEVEKAVDELMTKMQKKKP